MVRPVRGTILVLAGGLAGCALSPDDIQPANVSSAAYEGWSCAQLSNEQHRLADALTAATARQTQAHNNDVAGVVLLGLPVSSMAGQDMAPQIAHLKGEQEAVRLMLKSKSGST